MTLETKAEVLPSSNRTQTAKIHPTATHTKPVMLSRARLEAPLPLLHEDAVLFPLAPTHERQFSAVVFNVSAGCPTCRNLETMVSVDCRVVAGVIRHVDRAGELPTARVGHGVVVAGADELVGEEDDVVRVGVASCAGEEGRHCASGGGGRGLKVGGILAAGHLELCTSPRVPTTPSLPIVHS